MHHRRSHSDPGDAKDVDEPDNDESLDEVESVASDTSSIHTFDLYTGWRIPDLKFSVTLPGWFVLLVTLLLFKGPSMPPSCVA
jgi:hypothetical protein